MTKIDVVIIGSGASGISSAFPLLEKNLFVTMIDAGFETETNLFVQSKNKNCQTYKEKIETLLGSNFEGLKEMSNYSPKLRFTKPNETPSYNSNLNNIISDKFLSTGSLKTGGLTNFWGAVSPKFTKEELGCSNSVFQEFETSYENIAKRIGISGTNDEKDHMSLANGKITNLQKPLKISENARYLLRNYNLKNNNPNFLLGRNRSAVLSETVKNRFGCNFCELCMSNCKSGSIYNSSFDLIELKKHPRFSYKDKSLVIKIKKHDRKYEIIFINQINNEKSSIFTRNIFLAAGTIVSTKLALTILKKFKKPYPILTTPMISMGLLLPKNLMKQTTEKKFGLGQLSFNIKRKNKKDLYGLIYEGTSFAASDLSIKLPFSKKTNLTICNTISSSLLIGLIYLSSEYTDNKLYISDKNELKVNITGSYKEQINKEIFDIRKIIALNFGKLGAFLIPGSFNLSAPGADVHYASTLPMGIYTSENGELLGAKGVYLVDGSCLGDLPAKNLTFTIMANADRIARKFKN